MNILMKLVLPFNFTDLYGKYSINTESGSKLSL